LLSARRKASSRVNGAATHGNANTLAARAATSGHPVQKHVDFMSEIPVMIHRALFAAHSNAIPHGRNGAQ
jgi:hypothetical protein